MRGRGLGWLRRPRRKRRSSAAEVLLLLVPASALILLPLLYFLFLDPAALFAEYSDAGTNCQLYAALVAQYCFVIIQSGGAFGAAALNVIELAEVRARLAYKLILVLLLLLQG